MGNRVSDEQPELLTDLRVLIVAADPMARGGLAALLDGQEGIMVAGRAPVDDEIAHAADIYDADLVVWDLGGSDVDAVARLADEAEAMPPVVALLADPALAGSAWAAGARGLLFRDVTGGRLNAAARAVVEGTTVLDAAFAESLLRRVDHDDSPVEPLTPREREVLALLAEGRGNKAVAAELGVSENTVKFHINAIFGKLGVQSRTEAVTRAARLGLILL